MANNKTYTVMKDDEMLKELKTLAAARKLADEEGAEVFCDGQCVYQGAAAASEDTVTDTAAETPAVEAPLVDTTKPEQYRLTARMNIRKAPDKSAEKLGITEKDTVVEVAAVEDGWLHLTDGTFILYEGGKFAVKI